jgi:hypothetical protein
VQFLNPASRDELILSWLHSEWDRTHPSRRLVDQADLSDPAQNAARAQMLFSIRANIVRELPYQMRPDWAYIEEADLPNLYIIPCSEWYLDTGCTFRLSDVPANLKAGRHPVDHLAKIDAIALSLADYESSTTSDVLMLNSADRTGPYTIIEGNHRGCALRQSPAHAQHAVEGDLGCRPSNRALPLAHRVLPSEEDYEPVRMGGRARRTAIANKRDGGEGSNLAKHIV